MKIKTYLLILLMFSASAWMLGCGAHEPHQNLSNSSPRQNNDAFSSTNPTITENNGAAANQTASLPAIPTSSEYMVTEPVSNDKVFIYEAGKQHAKSIVLIQDARGSRLVLTGVHLTADTAIVVSGSILDLAAVTLNGHKAAVQAKNGSELLFSISQIRSPFNLGTIHGLYEVVKKKPL